MQQRTQAHMGTRRVMEMANKQTGLSMAGRSGGHRMQLLLAAMQTWRGSEGPRSPPSGRVDRQATTRLPRLHGPSRRSWSPRAAAAGAFCRCAWGAGRPWLHHAGVVALPANCPRALHLLASSLALQLRIWWHSMFIALLLPLDSAILGCTLITTCVPVGELLSGQPVASKQHCAGHQRWVLG